MQDLSNSIYHSNLVIKHKRQGNIQFKVIEFKFIAVYQFGEMDFESMIEKIAEDNLLTIPKRKEGRPLFFYPPYARFRGVKYIKKQNSTDLKKPTTIIPKVQSGK